MTNFLKPEELIQMCHHFSMSILPHIFFISQILHNSKVAGKGVGEWVTARVNMDPMYGLPFDDSGTTE